VKNGDKKEVAIDSTDKGDKIKEIEEVEETKETEDPDEKKEKEVTISHEKATLEASERDQTNEPLNFTWVFVGTLIVIGLAGGGYYVYIKQNNNSNNV